MRLQNTDTARAWITSQTKPLSTLHLKLGKIKSLHIINDVHFEVEKITSAANRFKLIYVQIKHDRCRVDFEHNTHFDKRREVSVQDKSEEEKRGGRRENLNAEKKMIYSSRFTLSSRYGDALFAFCLHSIFALLRAVVFGWQILRCVLILMRNEVDLWERFWGQWNVDGSWRASRERNVFE